jgi:hypothetical protein
MDRGEVDLEQGFLTRTRRQNVNTHGIQILLESSRDLALLRGLRACLVGTRRCGARLGRGWSRIALLNPLADGGNTWGLEGFAAVSVNLLAQDGLWIQVAQEIGGRLRGTRVRGRALGWWHGGVAVSVAVRVAMAVAIAVTMGCSWVPMGQTGIMRMGVIGMVVCRGMGIGCVTVLGRASGFGLIVEGMAAALLRSGG